MEKFTNFTFNRKRCSNSLIYPTFDIITLIISLIYFFKEIKNVKPAKICSPNKYLQALRLVGCFMGILYLYMSFQWDNVPLGRFLIGKFRFLTEDFFIYLTLYYVCVTIYPYFYGYQGSRVLNILFCTNFFGAIFVTVGFWTILGPIAISVNGFNKFDLLGHCFNFLFILLEYYLIPEIHMQDISLQLLKIMLCSYCLIMYLLERFGFICWIPYGPFLKNAYYKTIFMILLGLGFSGVKKLVSRKRVKPFFVILIVTFCWLVVTSYSLINFKELDFIKNSIQL